MNLIGSSGCPQTRTSCLRLPGPGKQVCATMPNLALLASSDTAKTCTLISELASAVVLGCTGWVMLILTEEIAAY